MTATPSSRVAAAALPLLLASVGCHLVWGDFEAAKEGTSANPTCTEGHFTCDDAGGLQQCRNATWTPFAACGRPEWCLASEGRCRVCEPGSFACEAQQLLQCSAAGDAWAPFQSCPASLVCDAVNGACATCRAGAAHCTSDRLALETCNTSASSWTLENCGTSGCVDEPDDCDYCGDCAPEGRWVCSPCGKVLRCEGSQWREVANCGRPETCVVEASSGYCVDPE
ncbi:MAG TPA: hypothetical protein PLU22_02435 [Polyangiaceae bacterium]|nr:hypothetical protein [Polyangiaceae bacterium]